MSIFVKRTNSRLSYNLKCLFREATPNFFFRRKLDSHLAEISKSMTEAQETRLQFYCKLSGIEHLPASVPALKNLPRGRSTYYCDLASRTRYFDPAFQLSAIYGDIRSHEKLPSHPCIAKSRPVDGENGNAILFKMNAVRHNVRIQDARTFHQKADKAVWRGVGHTAQRVDSSVYYANNDRVDIGLVGYINHGVEKPRMSISDQLNNKFVISMQGVDLATNLHWIMASNSVLMMPEPKNEGWSMETLMQPGVHYVQVADDLHDIEEKMDQYLSRPDDAIEITRNAQNYVSKFYDKRSEFALQLSVLYRYFQRTGQMD